MVEQIKIRDANIEDLPTLLVFEQKLIEAERPMDVTIRLDEINYYDVKAYILNDSIKLLVAEVDGKVVSSGYAIKKRARHYLNHKEYAYLGFMYTMPDYRGKGINRLIIEALKKWSYQNGLKEIRLTVYNKNPSAIKAYEKVGFKQHLIEMRIEKD